MHHHLEIIMPPTTNVEKVVEEIMHPFMEEPKDPEESNGHPFWDFYVIGGRFSGNKILARFDKDQLQKFYTEMNEKKITVSSVQFGKQELQPPSQIPIVDEMWRKHFPNGGEVCPLFRHYNDQHKHSVGGPDVVKLSEIPKDLTASRVIVAGPGWVEGSTKAEFMIETDFWNGVSINAGKWEGNVMQALEEFKKKSDSYRDEWKQTHMPTDEWLCVTVDYHS